MTRRLLIALAVLFASSLAASNIGHAQTFKVEKFDLWSPLRPAIIKSWRGSGCAGSARGVKRTTAQLGISHPGPNGVQRH